MADATDHVTGKTGLSPTVTLSKNGGAYASPAGAVSEVGNGLYKVAGNATDSSTLGPLWLHATASGADPCDDCFAVVAYDPQDAVRLGQTALPNAAAGAAGGLPTLDGSSHLLVYSVSQGVTVSGTKTTLDALNDLSAAGVRAAVGEASANLDTQLAAIKSDTGTILADVNSGAGAIYTVLTSSGVVLAANAITSAKIAAGAITDAAFAVPAEAAGRPTGFLSMLRRGWEWLTNKTTRDRSTGVVTLFGADNTTVLEQRTQSTASTVDTISKGA